MIARLVLILSTLAWPVTRTHQDLIDLVGRKGDITHLYDLYLGQDSLRDISDSLGVRLDSAAVRLDSLEAGGGGTTDLSGAVILAPNSLDRNLIIPTANSVRGLVIQGRPAQSGSLFMARNSASTNFAYIANDLSLNVNIGTTGVTDATTWLQTLAAASGDPKVVFAISGGSRWGIGVDNTDGDAFVLSRSDLLGTSNALRVTTGGDVGVSAGDLTFGTAGKGVRYQEGPVDIAGSGSPEGVVAASPGSTYRNSAGGAGTSFYVKESGTGNTGWVAK